MLPSDSSFLQKGDTKGRVRPASWPWGNWELPLVLAAGTVPIALGMLWPACQAPSQSMFRLEGSQAGEGVAAGGFICALASLHCPKSCWASADCGHRADCESPGRTRAGGAGKATGWGWDVWAGLGVFPGICSASVGSSQPETRRLLFLGVSGGRSGEGGWSQPGAWRICAGRMVATKEWGRDQQSLCSWTDPQSPFPPWCCLCGYF